MEIYIDLNGNIHQIVDRFGLLLYEFLFNIHSFIHPICISIKMAFIGILWFYREKLSLFEVYKSIRVFVINNKIKYYIM